MLTISSACSDNAIGRSVICLFIPLVSAETTTFSIFWPGPEILLIVYLVASVTKLLKLKNEERRTKKSIFKFVIKTLKNPLENGKKLPYRELFVEINWFWKGLKWRFSKLLSNHFRNYSFKHFRNIPFETFFSKLMSTEVSKVLWLRYPVYYSIIKEHRSSQQSVLQQPPSE